MVEVDDPRVVGIAGKRRRRPKPGGRRGRKEGGIDGRGGAALLHQGGKLLNIGQPPVGVAGKAGPLRLLQGPRPGKSLELSAPATSPGEPLGALLPHQAGGVVGHRAIVMIGVAAVWGRGRNIAVAGLGGIPGHKQINNAPPPFQDEA